MATKSIGTMKAFLKLDANGFITGFVQAEKAANKFAHQGTSQATKKISEFGVIGGRVGGVLKALGLAGIVAGTALTAVAAAGTLAYKAGRHVFAAMQSIEKTFGGEWRVRKRSEEAAEAIKKLGLNLSATDIGKVLEANDAFHRLGAVVDSVWKKVAVELTPVIVVGIEKIIERIQSTGEALKNMGITWDTVGDVFISFGAVAISVFDAVAAKIEESISLTKGFVAAINLARSVGNLDAAGIAKSVVGGTDAARGIAAANAKFANVLGGKSAMDFIGRATAFRTGGGAFAGESKFAGALERGSVEAARAVTAAGGIQHFAAIEKNTKEAVGVLSRIERDAAAAARRADGAPLRPSTIRRGT